MTSPLLSVIEQICQEKKIKPEQVIAAIEQALSAAYRREFHAKNQNIQIQFNPQTQEIRVFDVKTVVEDMALEEEPETKKATKTKEKNKKEVEKTTEERPRFNPKTQIMLSEAKKIKPDIKVGEEIRTELPVPKDFGRVAAQTAKQVIIQKLREFERQSIYDLYKQQEGKVVSGVIQRRERDLILVDLSDAEAILPLSEQVQEEKYQPGMKLKFLILAVNQTTKGPQIILSRRAPQIVLEIFKEEIPEIANGTVEIKNIVREAGYRTKVVVFTEEKGVDPVGSCIGQRGVRIQTIINALGGEKVDVIEYNPNPVRFIANAVAPAKATEIKLNEKEKKALVIVKPNQLSLAIGRSGLNAKLISELTGWTIEIRSEEEIKKETVGESQAQEELKTAPADKQ
jgi:N utilization substance protein A